MNMVWLASVIIGLSLVIFSVLWWRLRYCFKSAATLTNEAWPRISILIPCRNEAHHLPGCLAALARLEYPQSQLELVLGDDQSDDNSLQLLQKFAACQTVDVKVISVKKGDLKRRNGKTNALMQLIAASTGELLLFTDADCEVGPDWAKSMVQAQQSSGAALITGITGMQSPHWYGRQQGIEWFFILGIVKVLDDLGYHVTSLGNNMLISRKAYEAVGGFEALPFTLTEDFEMAKSLQNAGFTGFHLLSAENHVFTKPELDPMRMLLQRKRWIGAFMQLHPLWIIGLIFTILLPLALLYVAVHLPWWALTTWLLHLLLQAGFIRLVFEKTKTKVSMPDLLLFDWYFLANSLFSILLYFWPSKIPWKGRRY